MKIDYELVKKIGATHYRECSDDSVDFYKFINGFAFCRNSVKNEEWTESILMAEFLVCELKPIPPKPPVRVEYEKVAESIFDLRDEFERGELYCKNLAGNDDFQLLRTVTALSGCYAASNIYRRIEKPVDWREVTSEWVQQNQSVNIDFLTNAVMYYHGSVSNEAFLEMCRVALRAKGEL